MKMPSDVTMTGIGAAIMTWSFIGQPTVTDTGLTALAAAICVLTWRPLHWIERRWFRLTAMEYIANRQCPECEQQFTLREVTSKDHDLSLRCQACFSSFDIDAEDGTGDLTVTTRKGPHQ